MSVHALNGSMQPPPKAISVSEFTSRIRKILAGSFGSLWVEGEVSNVTRARSGHLYFTVKDDKAALSCVMWRYPASKLRFGLEDGLKVEAFGSIDVYPPRGQYQFIVQDLRPKGIGELQLAFEQLRARLQSEGLFDKKRKKSLPRVPSRVGIVTSPTGAAVRDIIQTAQRRCPGVDLLIAPAKVQGDGAAVEIARAIEVLDKGGLCDVIIVARGGGAIEDLWAFNDENLARTVAACSTPVVSGVGHEIDFTIVDYVADVRAPTPTGAAELVVPLAENLHTEIEHLQQRLHRAMESRLRDAMLALGEVSRRLDRLAPMERLKHGSHKLEELTRRLESAMENVVTRKDAALRLAAGRLHAMSPLAVLDRGYAVVRREDDGRVVKDASEVAIGDPIDIWLARGKLACRVEKAVPAMEQAPSY